MEQTTEVMVVGVRFSKVGKVYDFSTNGLTDLKVGDMVVVETSRGWQLGQVAQLKEDAEPPPDGWKPIDRRATPRDLLLRQMWQQQEAQVVSNCKAKATELNLVGIKIVTAEYSFDGARLTILFSSETEEKYDLKSLRSDMQKMFAPSQVEMRQVGPRDVAKLMCGMGACGLEKRCCCSFLTEFSSISIRMAKEQGISLTPTEITGMCGRLRCCLIYEYETYVDARQQLPKRNKRVRTPQGEGKVVDVAPLRGTVIVDLPEVGYREFPGSEVTLADDSGGAPTQAPPAAKEEKKDPSAGVDVPFSGPEDGYTAKSQGRPSGADQRTEPTDRRTDERPRREGRRDPRGGGSRREGGNREGKRTGQEPTQRSQESGAAPREGGGAQSGQSQRSRRPRPQGQGGKGAGQGSETGSAEQKPQGKTPKGSTGSPRDRGPRSGREHRRRGRQQNDNNGTNNGENRT